MSRNTGRSVSGVAGSRGSLAPASGAHHPQGDRSAPVRAAGQAGWTRQQHAPWEFCEAAACGHRPVATDRQGAGSSSRGSGRRGMPGDPRSVQRHDPRAIALWKMEGFTTEEIASKLDCTTRTVERKLQLIRRLWNWGEPHDDRRLRRPHGQDGVTDSQLWRIDQICDGFETAWNSEPAAADRRVSRGRPGAGSPASPPRARAPRCPVPQAPGRISRIADYQQRFPELDDVAGCRADRRLRGDHGPPAAASFCGRWCDPGIGAHSAARDDGQRTFGKFQLLERVGVGGFGTVWPRSTFG